MVYNSGYLAGLKVQIFDFLPRDIFPATFYPVILKKDFQTFRFSDLPVISLKTRPLITRDYLVCDFLPFSGDFHPKIFGAMKYHSKVLHELLIVIVNFRVDNITSIFTELDRTFFTDIIFKDMIIHA